MIDVGDDVAVEVAWDDDTVNRWVLLWYRYDPDRHERRNTVVGAYTESSEFGVRLDERVGHDRHLRQPAVAPSGAGGRVRSGHRTRRSSR